MAYLTLFHVSGRQTPVRRLDPRVKIAGVICLSIAVFMTGCGGMIILTAAAGILIGISGIPLGRLFRDMRFLFILAVIIFSAGALADGFTRIDRASLAEGGTAAWKFLLFILFAAVFTGTTTPGEIRDGLTAVLKPVRFVPAVRIATMISLALTFVPLVFDQIRTVSEAQTSRCAGLRKNPVRSFRLTALPVIIGIFRTVENIADAMESRCYTEDRSTRSLHIRASGWIVLLLTPVLSAALIVIPEFIPFRVPASVVGG